jgi:HSP20 family protein
MSMIPWNRFGFEPTLTSDIVPLRRDLDRFFDRFLPFFGFGETPKGWTTEMWTPIVSLNETEKEFILTAEIPGVTKDDVKVEAMGNTLTISGEKKDVMERKEGATSYSERFFGTFKRTFRLPENVILDDVNAEFANGLLTVKVPKAQPAKAHRVKVKEKIGV